MPEREIPKTGWDDFCDDFSRLHEGELVNVEIFGDGTRVKKTLAKNLPLGGVSADFEPDFHGQTVSVIAGEEPDDHLTHIVEAPKRLSIEETEEGEHKALRIEAEDGSSVVVRLRS